MLVGQLHHIIAIRPNPFTVARLDHDGTVSAIGFLKARVAVEPVSASLLDRKPVSEGFTRSDTVEADTGNAVLLEGQDQPVPMN